ncbi:CusA/CzcA family heavy metal efflux RND transporter [Termitidicoccus mucosus]|uniref:efflux RND transporter permease subunit n=1 Tax=Termitidicoccus mucosus TaxID=1184151 RepID=UPI003183A90F
MISRLITWSLGNRFLVIAAFLGMCAWGVHALRTVPIDAIPDLSENQVIVYADWPGRSPQEVEDQITYPLSVSLQGLAGVRTVRATSMFGFSFLTVIFNDDVENYFARTRVLERLNSLGDILPENVSARLGPDATGLGWVYQYYLKTDPKTDAAAHDLGSLRTLQDTFIRYQLENGAEFVVRGVGLVTSTADIEAVPLAARAGTPLYLRDIARVEIGGDFRRGTLDIDGREVVGGIVVMRYGENAHQVIRDIKARIADISPGLPAGVTIEPFYDRSGLIERAIDTLKHALVEEIILVTLAHILFLFHFRSILIVTLPLPASILISFILMKEFGIPSHIMSLTGIAISIGVLVDAGIVMTENVIRHCERALEEKQKTAPPSGPAPGLSAGEIFQLTLRASTQVGRPMFFSMAIIILAFVPVFLLTGQEGKLFHPLAYTKTFALIGAVLLAITAVPVFCTLLVRGPFRPENKNHLMRFLLRIYDPVLDWALIHRKTVLSAAAVLLVFSCVLALGLPRALVERLDRAGYHRAARAAAGFGSEFMPTLEEGSLLFMPVLLPATSLTEVKRIMAWQDKVISQHPEVLMSAGKLGRSDTATDPAPIEMIETTITLKPQDQWRPGVTKQQIVAELSDRLTQVPGYVPGFLQPIENRILMTSTGIRAQVGVKIFGDDLNALQRKASEIERIINTIPGATGVAPSRDVGKPYLEIAVRRDQMGRYGLRAADILAYVETGLGGSTATTTIKGRERWPVQVRLERADRDDIEKLRHLLIPTPAGPHITLGQVADIKRVIGPNEISSENGRLRVFVQANVRDRDLGSFVGEIKQRIQKEITLDPGQTVEYSGQYENQIRAGRTLRIVFPTVIVIIFLLLVMTFRSVLEAAHVILAVPFALTGGVILQAFLGYNFSVAVWVGYIALFGTAIQTGIIMVLYLEEAVQKARDRKSAAAAPPIENRKSKIENSLTRPELIAAIKEGARLRLRPKVMTVATTIASLLPIFWATRTGTEIMRPLATPVVGGMISSLLHILIVTPVLFALIHERKLKNKNSGQPS